MAYGDDPCVLLQRGEDSDETITPAQDSLSVLFQVEVDE